MTNAYSAYLALHQYPHDSQVLFLFLEGPLPQQELRRHLHGGDTGAVDFHSFQVEKAGVPEPPHPFSMTRVAQGLFHHLRSLACLQERTEAVGIEGFQGAYLGEIHELHFGQGRDHNGGPVPANAGRPGVLLDDVQRREGCLVLEGPATDDGEAAHHAFEAGCPVQLLLQASDDHVTASRGYPGIHDGHHTLSPGQLIQEKGVLGKEGDVHGGLPRLQDGLEGFEAHEAGDGPDTQVVVPHDLLHLNGIGEICQDGVDGGDSLQRVQGFGGDVDDSDLKLRVLGQVHGHGLSYSSCSENSDLHERYPVMEGRLGRQVLIPASLSGTRRGRSKNRIRLRGPDVPGGVGGHTGDWMGLFR